MKSYWKEALAGVLTGVAVGYITAPDSGKKNRKKLAEVIDKQTNGLTSSFSNQWNKTVSMALEVIDHVKDQSGIFSDEVITTVDDSRNDATGNFHAIPMKIDYNDGVDKLTSTTKLGVTKAKHSLIVD